MYKKILKKYDTRKILIKTHPRETTDYSSIFSNIKILNKPIPYELLEIIGFNPEVGVTLFSTAVFCVKNRIDFYGSEVHPKILKHFGNCDYLMKRNKII